MPIRKVSDPALLGQLNAGNDMVTQNPLYPSQLQQAQGQAAAAPYAAPKAETDLARARTEAGIAQATAPAEIAQKNANARQTAAQAATAEANLETTGGANEGQAKSASFYTRASRANKLYEGTGINDNPGGREIAKTLLPDALVNTFTSSARQRAEAAQRDFIASTLRYESGANIPQNEFELQKSIYFPAPGDDPETVKLKAQLRANAINGLRVASGPAAEKLDSDQPDRQQEMAAPQVVPASGKTVTEYDPQTAAAVDRMIRMGRPNREIMAFAKSKGYNPPTNLDEAKLYLKQNPGYKGGFTVATKERQTTARERLSASPLGAALSAAGSAATLGLDDEAAGLVSRLGGEDYARGRDAYNAGKQLLADANPGATLAGTLAGSLAPFSAAARVAGAAGLPTLLAPAAKYGQTAEQAASVGANRAGMLTDALVGGAYGAGENNDNRLLGASAGAAGAGVGNIAGRKLAGGLASIISPTGGELAPLYNLGVRPSLGQRFGGVAGNLEEKMQSLPFVGDAIHGTRQRARNQFQIGLFNDALGDIGQKLPKGMEPGHAPHSFAQRAFNKAYDAAKSRMTAAADQGFGEDIGALQQSVGQLAEGSQRRFGQIWKDQVARRFANGQLSGDAYKQATSQIEKAVSRIRKNPQGDGELADALEQAGAALRASAVRNSSPEAVAALDAVDRGYAKMVRIEDASKRAGGEAATFTPDQYNSAVKSGDSTVRNRNYLAGDALNSDLAAAGLNLRDMVSNSGTVDRYAPLALATGLGWAEPKSLLAIGGYGLMNAPGVRNLTTGLLAPRAGKAKTIAEIFRKQLAGPLGMAGAGGGLGLVPLLPPH